MHLLFLGLGSGISAHPLVAFPIY